MLERPLLIVFSLHADDSLWAEVPNLGKFDLLAAPFREEELVFSIGSAWLDWKSAQDRGAGYGVTDMFSAPTDLAIRANRFERAVKSKIG